MGDGAGRDSGSEGERGKGQHHQEGEEEEVGVQGEGRSGVVDDGFRAVTFRGTESQLGRW